MTKKKIINKIEDFGVFGSWSPETLKARTTTKRVCGLWGYSDYISSVDEVESILEQQEQVHSQRMKRYDISVGGLFGSMTMKELIEAMNKYNDEETTYQTVKDDYERIQRIITE